MSGRPRLGRLHVITDVVLQSRFTHGEVTRLALEGGAGTIQFREKRPLTTRELIEEARSVVDFCRAAGGTCIIDDRVDVAAALNAEGVHLGRNDLPAEIARDLLGSGVLIGGTANSLEEARLQFTRPVDYLGIGPVFGTNSKANPAPVLGLDNLRAIVAESPVPIIAIGNISPENVASVLDAGAFGVAVLSRVTCMDDPAAAAREFATAIEDWLVRAEAAK